MAVAVVGKLGRRRRALLRPEGRGGAISRVSRHRRVFDGDQIACCLLHHWVDHGTLGVVQTLSAVCLTISITAKTAYVSPWNGRSLAVACMAPPRSGMAPMLPAACITEPLNGRP